MKVCAIFAYFLLANSAFARQIEIEPRPIEPRAEICSTFPNWMSLEDDRIVGGKDAKSPIPWQASIRKYGGHHCGGTILNANTILSAMHCFYYLPIGIKLEVAAGALTRNNLKDAQVVVVTKIIANTEAKFDGQTNDNDIALLIVSPPLVFNKNVTPACLPPAAGFAPENNNSLAVTSGWGDLASNGGSPDLLQYVAVPLMTNEACRKTGNGGSIYESMICAGPLEGGKDSCQGDSGGPLVVKDASNRAIIYGIVSWGIGCADPGYPGVYARVTKFINWIVANMGMGCGSPKYTGDAYCDDDNNNAGCNYDGGDCCGNNVNTSFCKVCACLDPESTTSMPTTKHSTTIVPTPKPLTTSVPTPKPSITTAPSPKPTQTTKLTPKPTQTTAYPTSPAEPVECGSPDYVGDAHCDDDNNNAVCNYDGGDCCGVDVSTSYCKVCACLDPDSTTSKPTPKTSTTTVPTPKPSMTTAPSPKPTQTTKPTQKPTQSSTPTPKPTSTAEPMKCGSPDYVGDGYCDDDNNNAACNYDGGDCCGVYVSTSFCKVCACLDPDSTTSKTTSKPMLPTTTTKLIGCGKPEFSTDAYCDDDNNNADCNFDDGACCGDNVNTTFCIYCACLQSPV